MRCRHSYWFLSLLGLLFFIVACKKEQPEWDGPVVELTFECDDPLATRSGYDGTQEGDDYYNENLISTLDIFFYPEDRTSQDAYYHVRRTSGKRRGDVIRLEFTSPEINSYIFPIDGDVRWCTVYAIANYSNNWPEGADGLDGTSVDNLMNLKVETDFAAPLTHMQPSFLMDGTTSLVLNGRTQKLVATGIIKLERFACKLQVGVNVASEKVFYEEDALGNPLIDEITGEPIVKERWIPMLQDMKLYLVDGAKNVCLSGECPEDELKYFSYNDHENPLKFATYDEGTRTLKYLFPKDGVYCQTDPMYTYPMHWVFGSDEQGKKEPYLKLILTWFNVTKGTNKEFYYKILIPNDNRPEYKRRFVRNNLYHINVDVSILGAENDDAMVTIPAGECFIVYWQDKEMVIKEAEVGKARYLAVDNDTYNLHNISTEVTIPYTSSHPVSFLGYEEEDAGIKVTRPYYGNVAVGSDALGGTVRLAGADDEFYEENAKYISYNLAQRKVIDATRRNVDVSEGRDWFFNNGTAVNFQHVLENDYTLEEFDYSPYYISFTLYHRDRPDDERYKKHIVIRQYPAIYIDVNPNSDPRVDTKPDGVGAVANFANNGYVYVDGGDLAHKDCYSFPVFDNGRIGRNDDYWNNSSAPQSEKKEWQWHVVWYTGGSTDLYNINITVLPSNLIEDNDFVIGDPRSPDVNNLLDFGSNPNTHFVEAPAMEGGSRRLSYYYPTEKSDRTRNMMAPAYRIASKLGGVEYGGISYDNAVARCATYQEDGYPAGRWRLPTRGEVRFIANLSAHSAFTYLFSATTYWSANGAVTVHTTDGGYVTDSNTGTALPRCVYDSWYWQKYDEDSKKMVEDRIPAGEARKVFMWGDKER